MSEIRCPQCGRVACGCTAPPAPVFVPALVTQNGTSVESEPDDPKNTGSKPEVDTKRRIWQSEVELY